MFFNPDKWQSHESELEECTYQTFGELHDILFESEEDEKEC